MIQGAQGRPRPPPLSVSLDLETEVPLSSETGVSLVTTSVPGSRTVSKGTPVPPEDPGTSGVTLFRLSSPHYWKVPRPNVHWISISFTHSKERFRQGRGTPTHGFYGLVLRPSFFPFLFLFTSLSEFT